VIMSYEIIAVIVVCLAVFVLTSHLIVVINGEQIGIVEKKYFGKKLPQNRVVALKGEIGIQAGTIGPGMHFFFPYLYAINKVPLMKIGENQVGLVEVVDGRPIQPGMIFARSVEGHDHFQDGEAFLKSGGQKGPQVDIIPPGIYRINTYLFRVNVADAIVVSQGQVGIINASDGGPMDPGRLLAKSVSGHNNYQDGETFLKNSGQKGPQMDILLPGVYRINNRMFNIRMDMACKVPAGKVGQVTANDGQPLPEHELVAKSTPGHVSYQNGAAFLNSGGQRGPQLDVLTPGIYYINPLMFSVVLDEALVVKQGQVAVIISNVGKEPDFAVSTDNQRVDRNQANQPEAADDGVGEAEKVRMERYVVPEGFRGIQKEVLGPGAYYLNKIAFIPVIVNTTNTTIDWDDSKDTVFDTLSVVSKDGFELKVGVKVVIRVQPEQAPFMVARIGSVDNLITNVIHPLIDSSFRNQASSAAAMQFLQNRHEQQGEALTRAINERHPESAHGCA
jgi:regulator of protease activity HflC (stomatin/prohibitin superfamily)